MASNDYEFVTHWLVTGTVQEVYDILRDGESLPRWWPSVYLDARKVSPPDGADAVLLHTKGWLPYHLHWISTIAEDNPPHGFSLRAAGDFEGSGVWTFQQQEDLVNIQFVWTVRAEKPLLRELSAVLKPIFSANHRWTMSRGEESLALELERRRAAPATRVPLPPGPTSDAAVSALILGAFAASVGLGFLVGRSLRR